MGSVIHGDNQINAIDNATVIISSLSTHGINHIFLVPGKLIYPFIRAIENEKNITGIMAAHESAAGYMADGYARVTSKFGVCLAISGPGVMNLVPAMAAAESDKIPVLYLAGGISTYHEAQGAFQDGSCSGINETNMISMLFKNSFEIKNSYNLKHYFKRVLHSLNSDFSNRAYLSLPIDIQKAKASFSLKNEENIIDDRYEMVVDYRGVIKVLDLLNTYQKIAVLVGSCLNNKKSSSLLLEFAKKYHIPITTSLSGKGSFPENNELSLGIYGFAGNKCAIDTIHNEIDVLIVLGCDLNQRDSLHWNPDLIKNRKVIYINNQLEKVNLHYEPDINIFSNIDLFLDNINSKDFFNKDMLQFRKKWVKKLKNIPLYDNIKYEKGCNSIHPGDAINILEDKLSKNINVVVDSGAHRIFMAHFWKSKGGGDYHTSNVLAPMGWAICAGIGVKLGDPQKECLVVTGDGCMLMHGIEIQTAAKYGLKIIFVIMNNNAHGAIHIDTMKKQGVSEDFSKLPNHNWKTFAESLGVKSYLIKTLKDLEDTLVNIKSENGPIILDIEVGNYFPPNDFYSHSVMSAEKTGGFNLVNYTYSSGVYHEQETQDVYGRI